MADIKDRVKGAIDTAADNTKEATDRFISGNAQQQGSTFMDTVRDKAQTAVHEAGDFAGHAKDRIGEYAGRVGDKVQHWAEDAADVAGHYAKDFGQEMTGMIRRYPIQSLLVGFGIGLLLGRVVRA